MPSMPCAGSGGDVIFGGMPPVTVSDASTLLTEPALREVIGPTESVTVTVASESTVTVVPTVQFTLYPSSPPRNW